MMKGDMWQDKMVKLEKLCEDLSAKLPQYKYDYLWQSVHDTARCDTYEEAYKAGNPGEFQEHVYQKIMHSHMNFWHKLYCGGTKKWVMKKYLVLF